MKGGFYLAILDAYGGEVRAVSWLGRRNAPDVLALFPGGLREVPKPHTRST